MLKRLVVVVFTLALIACSVPSIGCDSVAVANTFKPLTTEWADAVALASSAPRVSLADPVAKLQEIRRRTQALTVPACGEDAKVSLLASMDSTIEGFLGFLSNQPEATTQQHFATAAVHMQDFQGRVLSLASPDVAAQSTAGAIERTNIALTPTATTVPSPTITPLPTMMDLFGNNVIASYTEQGYTREDATSDGRPVTILAKDAIRISIYGSPVDAISLENTAFEEGAAGVAVIEDLIDAGLPGNDFTTGFTDWAYGRGTLSKSFGRFQVDANIDPDGKRATYTVTFV